MLEFTQRPNTRTNPTGVLVSPLHTQVGPQASADWDQHLCDFSFSFSLGAKIDSLDANFDPKSRMMTRTRRTDGITDSTGKKNCPDCRTEKWIHNESVNETEDTERTEDKEHSV